MAESLDRGVIDAVDGYLAGLFAPEDEALRGALALAAERGLPAIQVSAVQGRLLFVLARLCGARRVLEIGTLGGYSTIWLGRALGDGGRLISLEVESKHAAVARENLARAGLADRCEVVVGDAVEQVERMVGDGVEPFDMVFIDADKEGYPAYLELAIRLTRPGGLIAADNVVRGGKVIDENSDDASVRGVRAFNEMVSRDSRVDAVAFAQVGVKGLDGLALAVVRGG